MNRMVDEYQGWPLGLSDVSLANIRSVLPRPSLIRIEGLRHQPLFLSVLLHGNETTSFRLLQSLARRYHATRPARSMMIFVGNVEAAQAGLRHLENQVDFNRIWNGTKTAKTKAHAMADEILAEARAARPFASIDVHNTTGPNPYYGCVNALRSEDLTLAAAISDVGVYYETPANTQSVAFSKICPAVTVECGQNGDVAGYIAIRRLVDAALTATTLADIPPAAPSFTLYETVARVLLEKGHSLSFGPSAASLCLPKAFASRNFTELCADEGIGELQSQNLPLSVENPRGETVTDDFIARDGDRLVTRRAVIPSMITEDLTIIRQDCLCYFMQRVDTPSHIRAPANTG